MLTTLGLANVFANSNERTVETIIARDPLAIDGLEIATSSSPH